MLCNHHNVVTRVHAPSQDILAVVRAAEGALGQDVHFAINHLLSHRQQRIDRKSSDKAFNGRDHQAFLRRIADVDEAISKLLINPQMRLDEIPHFLSIGHGGLGKKSSYIEYVVYPFRLRIRIKVLNEQTMVHLNGMGVTPVRIAIEHLLAHLQQPFSALSEDKAFNGRDYAALEKRIDNVEAGITVLFREPGLPAAEILSLLRSEHGHTGTSSFIVHVVEPLSEAFTTRNISLQPIVVSWNVDPAVQMPAEELPPGTPVHEGGMMNHASPVFTGMPPLSPIPTVISTAVVSPHFDETSNHEEKVDDLPPVRDEASILALREYIQRRRHEWFMFHYNFLGVVGLFYWLLDHTVGTHYSSKSRDVKLRAAEKLINCLEGQRVTFDEQDRYALTEGRLGNMTRMRSLRQQFMEPQDEAHAIFSLTAGSV